MKIDKHWVSIVNNKAPLPLTHCAEACRPQQLGDRVIFAGNWIPRSARSIRNNRF